MKAVMRMLKIGLLPIVMVATLTGCATSRFEKIGTLKAGDKSYDALFTERVNPWGANAVSLHLVESDCKPAAQPQQCVYAMPQQVPMQVPQVAVAQQVVTQQVPMVVCQPPPCVAQCAQPIELLTNTHVVNNNNASSIGWCNGAFQGAVGDALLGGGMVGAAAVLRPARISASGGSSSANSCSSANAAAAAAARASSP